MGLKNTFLARLSFAYGDQDEGCGDDDHASSNSMLTKIYIEGCPLSIQSQFILKTCFKVPWFLPMHWRVSTQISVTQWPTCWPACFFPSLGHLLPVCLMVQSSLLGAIWSVRWTQGHNGHRCYPSFISKMNTRWLCQTKPWQSHGFQLT